VFLNDGIYGAMFEFSQIGIIDRITVLSETLVPRSAPIRARVTFGPTCDSVDRLPGEVPLASDVQEGDFIVFQGMGAYSTVTNSRFNGFGELGVVTVLSLKV
jgi:ornithine decarboxylase